jgi:hypothetical protein
MNSQSRCAGCTTANSIVLGTRCCGGANSASTRSKSPGSSGTGPGRFLSQSPRPRKPRRKSPRLRRRRRARSARLVVLEPPAKRATLLNRQQGVRTVHDFRAPARGEPPQKSTRPRTLNAKHASRRNAPPAWVHGRDGHRTNGNAKAYRAFDAVIVSLPAPSFRLRVNN